MNNCRLFRASLFICLIFQLPGCAWKEFKWFSKDKKDTQLQKVGAKPEEVEKFTVTSVDAQPEAIPAVPENKVPESKVDKLAPTVKKPAVAKTPAKVTKATTVPVPVVPAEFVYPKDYPEELKALDKEARVTWELFKPNFNDKEKMFLDVDYLGMTVGKVVVGYRGLKAMNGKPVYHFQAFFKTAPFYSAIYELDDQLDTFVDQKDFVALRYNLTQRESKQDVDEVQLYDRDKLTTIAYQKRVKDKETKNKKWKGSIPRWTIDPMSALWLMRGLPLKDGDKYTVPIVNKGKTMALHVHVEGREKLQIKGKDYMGIRVHAATQYTGTTLKSGDMMMWFADDSHRSLIRAKAKIKIGSVYLELAKEE